MTSNITHPSLRAPIFGIHTEKTDAELVDILNLYTYGIMRDSAHKAPVVNSAKSELYRRGWNPYHIYRAAYENNIENWQPERK